MSSARPGFVDAWQRGFRAGQAKARAELEPPIDRVRRLHSQDDDYLRPGRWCPACGYETPCPTIRALNGAL